MKQYIPTELEFAVKELKAARSEVRRLRGWLRAWDEDGNGYEAAVRQQDIYDALSGKAAPRRAKP